MNPVAKVLALAQGLLSASRLTLVMVSLRNNYTEAGARGHGFTNYTEAGARG